MLRVALPFRMVFRSRIGNYNIFQILLQCCRGRRLLHRVQPCAASSLPLPNSVDLQQGALTWRLMIVSETFDTPFPPPSPKSGICMKSHECYRLKHGLRSPSLKRVPMSSSVRCMRGDTSCKTAIQPMIAHTRYNI